MPPGKKHTGKHGGGFGKSFSSCGFEGEKTKGKKKEKIIPENMKGDLGSRFPAADLKEGKQGGRAII